MIRNVVMVELKPDHDPSQVAEVMRGFAEMNYPGTLGYTLGRDLNLREGNWSFAIVADFVDRDAYQRYDRGDEHARLRAELAPHVQQIARVQFEL